MPDNTQDLFSKFKNQGSTLGVPISPNTNQTALGNTQTVNSDLHNEYSNIGTPATTPPAYTNFGAAAIAYSTPKTSELGEATQAYQEPTNRYANNIPAGAIGGV